MTRDEFLAFLARLVMDDEIDEEEAADMLRRFDAGRLRLDPPLPPERMNVEASAAAMALALLAAGRRGGRIFEELRAEYDAEVRRLAEQQARGRLTVAAWQALLWDAVQGHTLAQAVAGGGRPDAATLAAIRQDLTTQGGYLSRFADVVARGVMVGAALSVAAVAARSIQYGAAGWAWHFKAREQGFARGYVIDYVAKDDERTCTPCLEAEEGGPYLPGEGPQPGEVCEGGGNCRCERVERYDLAAWRELAGE